MMTQDEMNNVADEALAKRPRRHQHVKPISDEGRFRQLRFWLNIIFMVAAVVGMVLWFTNYRDIATYILIGAIVPKFVEVTLRIVS